MNLRRRPSEEETAWQHTVLLWDAAVDLLKVKVEQARIREYEEEGHGDE